MINKQGVVQMIQNGEKIGDDYFVNKVYPQLSLDCLDAKVIKKARKMAQTRSKNHLWKNMKDEELLRTSNLILVDPNTNEEGISLACILLFGKDNTIMSVLPQHKTDAIFRVENKDRYDDRDVVITNLIDSYDRLIAFGQKHLNDLFVLDGMVNVNARDLILREIVSNTLAHRDYSSGFPARMIIDDEKIMVENSNLAYRSGILDPKKFHPIAKNPPISKVFREIGIADELGSGMRNTFKYTKLYSGALPTFEEGDIFRTIIPLKRIATEKVGPSNPFIAVRSDDISSEPERAFPVVAHKCSSHVAHKEQKYDAQDVAHNVARNVAHSDARNVAHQNRPPIARVVSPKPAPGTPAINIDLTEFIRLCVAADPTITRKAIAEEAGVSVKTIERYMKAIPNLRYVGRGKYGHWELD